MNKHEQEAENVYKELLEVFSSLSPEGLEKALRTAYIKLYVHKEDVLEKLSEKKAEIIKLKEDIENLKRQVK